MDVSMHPYFIEAMNVSWAGWIRVTIGYKLVCEDTGAFVSIANLCVILYVRRTDQEYLRYCTSRDCRLRRLRQYQHSATTRAPVPSYLSSWWNLSSRSDDMKATGLWPCPLYLSSCRFPNAICSMALAALRVDLNLIITLSPPSIHFDSTKLALLFSYNCVDSVLRCTLRIN